MDISASIEGEVQLSRRLMIMADGVTDFSDPLGKTGTELNKSFQENFDARGGLFQDGGWADRAKEYGWPILERTGTMRNSFETSQSKLSLTPTNKVPYFKYHQSNKSRKTHLPRRIMMKIDSQRRDFIIKAFQLYLVRLRRSTDV